MATARRREARSLVIDQAAFVWHLFGGELTEWHLNEYIRCGQLPTGDATRIPYIPDVERHIAKIVAAGKFVMPSET